MFLLKVVKAAPFSTMAICNILGDLCYLGFAFDADGLVSGPKLLGSLFTLAAHGALLAYGDEHASYRIAEENSLASRFLGSLRRKARGLVLLLPQKINELIRAKPVGVPFTMLALNGVGLLIDSLSDLSSFSMSSQFALGLCITLGCSAFALADFHPEQKISNVLLKIAPILLTSATVANGLVAISTLNLFMILSTFLFLVSNLAGFFAKIDKRSAITANG